MSFYQSALISSNVIGLWELYLLWRQRRSFDRKDVHPQVKEIVDAEEFEKSQAYGKEKATYSVITHIKDVVIANVQLLWKIPSKLYYRVASTAKLPVGGYGHCYLYSLMTDIILTILGVPFAYYRTFVIEEKHGFNKMSKWEFVKDEVKSLFLRAALLHPLQTALIKYVVQKFGDRFPLYFFAASSVAVLLFTFIFPTLIQPLFNTFTPLDDRCDLHAKIQAVADSLQFPLKKVLITDGSRRSAHSNAYMYGFWKNKRIVIYDTLLEQLSHNDDQILAILCHELGHWKMGHTTIMMGITLLNLMSISYGAKAVIFNNDMYQQFGFKEPNPVVGFDIFAQVFLQPIMTLGGYALMSLSRVFEFQADRFAVTMNYGPSLQQALTNTIKYNKQTLTPDPLYSALTSSHPPLIQRLEALEGELKKHN